MYFDQVAQEWDKMVTHDSEKIKFLLDKFCLPRDAKVLDVGSGTGILVPFLLDKAPDGRIFEMDISAKMLEVARQKYSDERLSFVCGDALHRHQELPEFDGVIAYSVFPHFSDQKEAIGALLGKLRPKGVLAILHSQSKEQINRLHGAADEASIRRDVLPPVTALTRWAQEKGAKALCTLDDERYFACILQAP